jgi:hypothetical protein
METFRGRTLIIPRTRDWKAIDATNQYSYEQRMKCQTESGVECSLYPFPIGRNVVQLFRPKRWLDPTAGWGDRLRVAIAEDVEYVGVDSNPSMQSAYRAIVADAGVDPKRFQVKRGRFQTVQLNGTFDLVFTSPPFFTKEVYEGMTEWEDVESFLTDFLRPLLKKSTAHLEEGGHIVLYIEDTPDAPFIELMKEYVRDELPALRYEGAFYYQGRTLRPYYVWVKETTSTPHTASRRRARS